MFLNHQWNRNAPLDNDRPEVPEVPRKCGRAALDGHRHHHRIRKVEINAAVLSQQPKCQREFSRRDLLQPEFASEKSLSESLGSGSIAPSPEKQVGLR